MFATCAARAVPGVRLCIRGSSGAAGRRRSSHPQRALANSAGMVTQNALLHPDVKEVLLTKEAIAQRVEAVGRWDAVPLLSAHEAVSVVLATAGGRITLFGSACMHTHAAASPTAAAAAAAPAHDTSVELHCCD